MKKFILLVCSLLSIPVSFAQDATPKEPKTTVLSDTLSYDDKTKTTLFKGNVTLTRGLLRLTANEMHIHEDAKGFKHGKATSAPNQKVKVYQERPESYETLYAEGDTATYDDDNKIITLIGSAYAIRHICGKAFDSVKGDIIRYDNQQGTYSVQRGKTPNERVRSVIQARSKVDRAIQECRKQYNNLAMPISDITP